MVPTLITIMLAYMSVRLAWYVVRSRSTLAASDREPRSPGAATHGDVIDIPAVVVDGPVLRSPLRGVPAVFWHARAITISSVRYPRLSRIEHERTSSDVFAVESDGVRLELDGRACRFSSGLVKVHGDQGSFARDLWVAGERIVLAPIAYGVRHVLEGSARPGDAIWIRGRLDTMQTPWRIVPVDEAHGVIVETAPREVRRTHLVRWLWLFTVLAALLAAIALVRIV